MIVFSFFFPLCYNKSKDRGGLMRRNIEEISESFFIACLLAVVGGFLDIYTYLLKGQVFATAETGNLILLGVHLSQGNIAIALHYFFPILFFGLGIIASESIRRFSTKNHILHWRQIILLVEICILFLLAFVRQSEWNTLVNSTISFISAIQIQSFRTVKGNPFASTMCTGNLRSGTEAFYLYLQQKERSLLTKSMHYFSIILCFVFGAILGAFAVKIFVERALCIPILFLLYTFFLLFQRQNLES